MDKILISACLLGAPVRYNGQDLLVQSGIVNNWLADDRIIPFCPEVSAGLPTPRAPAEIQGGSGLSVLQGTTNVTQNDGVTVTDDFLVGAHNALELCLQHKIKIAILTESSPSCGSSTVYSGDFSGTKMAGSGVTSALLMNNGIRVFNQHQIAEAQDFLNNPD